MAEKKEKQYVSDSARLMAEWNWERNQRLKLDPHKLSIGSGQKAWWICSKGHEWNAVIASRSRGSGCPYCSGRFAESGVNDFETIFPDIAKEWDYQKNSDLPSQTTCHSHKKVWWVCPNGHSYQATVQHRSYGDNCPYCSGQKVLAGYNDLASSYPQLALEWNYERNTPLLPSEVTSRSGLKVWWKCDKGHEWQSAVYSRQNGNGCPICSNKAVLAGFNDLSTCNPELAKEWNYSRNGPLLPTMVTTNSGKKVWWVCSRGHEWQASVDHRTRGRGCPICLTDRRSSFPEQAIFYYVSQQYACALNRYKLNQRYELDIFIPELNVAIEYDGIYFHTSEKSVGREKNKNAACYREKILLIRVKEDTKATSVLIQHWNPFLIKIIYNPQKDYSNLQQALDELFHILKKRDDTLNLHVNLENDRTEILSLLKQSDVADNLEEKCPEIATEWNYSRNGLLRPNSFAWASNQSVWWICPQGHEYQAKISNRTVLNRNCPICAVQKRSESRHQRSVEKHNFQDWCYEHDKAFLIDEWDIDANDGKTPNNYSTGSNYPVWWACRTCGYKWQALIPNRIKGTGCPQCSIQRRKMHQNSKPVIGDNSLTSWCHKNNRTDLLSEWHCSKNQHPAEHYTFGSHTKVWWKCHECGNEWEAEIKARVRGNGCPVCRRKKK